MRSPKFSLEFRLAVVTHYLNTRDGYRETAKRFGVSRTAVRRWISAWQQHGIDGLTWKTADYTPEFRLKVVRAVINDKLSLRDATAKFNLSGESTVYQWVKRFQASGAGALSGIKSGRPKKPEPMHKDITSPPAPHDNSPDAQAELRYLRAEVAWLKRAEGLDGGKFQRRKALIIQELRREHGLNDLLRAAGMARSTFYHNLSALRKADKHLALKELILDIYHLHKGRYGYRRITLALRRSNGPVNHKTVQRLMGELSLRAVIRIRKYRSWKGQVGKIAPNRLQRDFTASSANEKWVSDVTEFAVNGEKRYLSPVIDAFNSEVIAYSLSERPVMALVDTMLDKAFTRLTPGDAPVLHTDQGWQYQMTAYQDRLRAAGVVQSVSRKGNCLDNAMAESFFGTLKSECFYLEEFNSIPALREAINAYIHYYNHERISLRLNGLSPVEFRLLHLKAA
ncbi:IS3 family transposase [Salmonella enterica]|nr:IS3 family transposase [Salmonella enterica]EGQ5771341.1 IS3 family transposase [Salmonella enterica]EHG4004531.1 IS3 family transposase [Salmonella enterica]EHG4005513.1 IS3 family transposase [Salmonella enterica]EHR4799019.1 IS3 family transposase [Salmonella enterica]